MDAQNKPKRKTKCKNCNEVKAEDDKRLKCHSCTKLGCRKCIKTVCCDCCVSMCEKCSDDSEIECGCYGNCTSCGSDVNRGTHGWPCRKCNKWLCDNDECHIKNKCKECKND